MCFGWLSVSFGPRFRDSGPQARERAPELWEREEGKSYRSGSYSTVNSAQRLSATLSIRSRGRVQIIDMLLGIILACEDIRTRSANLQICAKILTVSVSGRLSCGVGDQQSAHFAGEKQIGRVRRVPIEVGPVAFRESFSLPVSAQLGPLGLLRLVLRSMASHPERAPKVTPDEGPFASEVASKWQAKIFCFQLQRQSERLH
jgi:hypothetical protein